jgi:manganese/zinc/iron transport system permease protein
MPWDWSIDGWIIVAGMLCAVAASLLGNLILLRRMSLMGDAISHSVLPGIAAAFLFTGNRGSLPVLLGAAAMGMLTVWLTESLRKYGNVEESAAIGVVFTTLFSIGLVMMVRAGDKIDLDPSCVLYGNLETIILDPSGLDSPFGPVPRVVLTLATICVLNLIAILIWYKQWQIVTFDPLLAHAQGISPGAFHYGLASLVAVTCIASFEAVGNILVVAMLVIPPATAFLICNRLSNMIAVSAMVAAFSACMGHFTAVAIPYGIGFRAFNSAAMIAVCCGCVLMLAVFFSPKAGVLHRWISNGRIARKILGDDILALLYRTWEHQETAAAGASPGALSIRELAAKLSLTPSKLNSVIGDLVRQNWIQSSHSEILLTDEGRRIAQNLVRSHRLWEQYMSLELNVSDSRLHAQAESLEHFTNQSMRGKLDAEIGSSSIDPHGRIIPPESQ